jgi:hypothetical protein
MARVGMAEMYTRKQEIRVFFEKNEEEFVFCIQIEVSPRRRQSKALGEFPHAVAISGV